MAKLLADALLIMHFLWVVFMVTGFLLAVVLRSPVLRVVHAVGLFSYLVLAVLGFYCPLTYGEEYFRQAATPGFSYQESFLATWVERIIYVENWGAPLWIFRLSAGLYFIVCLTSFWWLPLRRHRR
ncbi:DUF2784 domain-containing protein [bacterium]|nr:DUF2784 domain-containing protein [bacterium]